MSTEGTEPNGELVELKDSVAALLKELRELRQEVHNGFKLLCGLLNNVGAAIERSGH